ncbi:hypothetical protein BKA64DRAFT_117741 [Cadophora sp. MPI-SDFR-AT-0126]|nr:hypothetical protein BKA64DRAFT_117741 [Leotiomycetes sp. MPI-SDFR-AT-0126]
MNIRRCATGEVIGVTEIHPFMQEAYGFPMWYIHRADFQQILHEAALEAGVKFLLGSPVERLDDRHPPILMRDGKEMKADLIIGADGIRCKVRSCILNDHSIEIAKSPHCAYRAMIPEKVLLSDPETANILSQNESEIWTGPESHIMIYAVRDGSDGILYNFDLCHRGDGETGKWNEPGDTEEMKAKYSKWEPGLQKVLGHITECKKWKLASVPPLPTWVSSSGRVVIIGDAAHGMLPYMAQGAAMAIEDGAALAESISRADSVTDLPKLLKVFEAVRKPRCEDISANCLKNAEIFHLPDGPAQEKRDLAMKNAIGRGDKKSNNGEGDGHKYSNESVKTGVFDYDAVKAMKTALGEER